MITEANIIQGLILWLLKVNLSDGKGFMQNHTELVPWLQEKTHSLYRKVHFFYLQAGFLPKRPWRQHSVINTPVSHGIFLRVVLTCCSSNILSEHVVQFSERTKHLGKADGNISCWSSKMHLPPSYRSFKHNCPLIHTYKKRCAVVATNRA